ncbi:hypothetical protein FISHEDRAFT_64377 [Fistulina hepatica ATCC 64428]|nr:hypothetical protein FISHEDRAFT_64377 [Fistulina hepatica ATCC 64428]
MPFCLSLRALLPAALRARRSSKKDANHSQEDKASRVDYIEDEDSADPPPDYTAFLENAQISRPEVLETIREKAESIRDEMTQLSLKIHDNPELAFKEFHTHKVLTEYLVGQGFDVTPSFVLPTAFKAVFTQEDPSGAPIRTIGLQSEMDALPGIGHACGHNLIAISGVTALVCLRAAMKKHAITGRVILLGTPAEEGPGGKIMLLDGGAYEGIDVCVMCHPSGGRVAFDLRSSLAVQTLKVEFRGKSAHAAGSPWDGINALDACNVAYSSISAMRQQMRSGWRVHGIIEPNANWAPNVIPDYASMRYMVRAPTVSEVETLSLQVQDCFRAAALATRCKVEIHAETIHKDVRGSLKLSVDFAAVVKHLYQADSILRLGPGAIGGSTDFGNVTYEFPSLYPHFAIPTMLGGGNHNPLFTAAARTPEAHAATIKCSVGMSAVACRTLYDDAFFTQVYDDWCKDIGK